MTKFFCVESPFVEHCFLEAGERLPDGVRSRVALRPQLKNSWGGAHGGLIATLLDASMTVAARYALDPEGRQSVATIDLAVTFIGQAKQALVCDAKVTARRGSMIYAQAQAENQDGDLVARAVATLRAMDT
jgi:uncharacterized protein (TIGR00369 family)